MMIIDSQVHAYERNHPGRPWAGFLIGPDEVTGEAMVAAMEAVGVAGAVLVSSFSLYGYGPVGKAQAVEDHTGHSFTWRDLLLFIGHKTCINHINEAYIFDKRGNQS